MSDPKFYCRAEDLAIGYGKTPLMEHIGLGVGKGTILTLIALFLNFDQRSFFAIREQEGKHCLFTSQKFNRIAGTIQFFLYGRPFHSEKDSLHFNERNTIFTEYIERSHCPGHRNVKAFPHCFVQTCLLCTSVHQRAFQSQLSTDSLQKIQSFIEAVQ